MDHDDTPKARASRLRTALHNAYGGHRFSVTSKNSGTGYGAITVTWENGPTVNDAKATAQPYGDPSLRYGGIQTSRTLSPGIQQTVDAIWDAASAPTPDKKIYPAKDSSHFQKWDHEGFTVPEGTDWSQKTWLADHVILPRKGEGAAMPPATKREPEIVHEQPRPPLRAVPDQPRPTSGAQRKQTALTLLHVMGQHISAMPDELWAPPARDAGPPGLARLQQVGNLVTGAILAELSGLVTAVHHTHAVPAKAEASAQLTEQIIERVISAENPVLRALAKVKEEAGK